jgi:hypothetical protein
MKTAGKTTDDQFIERCQRNQSVFSSFIDLIPSKIYLNPDDHSNWLKHVTKDEPKKKTAAELDTNNKQNGNGKIPRSDGEDSDMEIEAQDEEFTRVNKFDPRVFKTVSQIFKDFQLMEEKVVFSFTLLRSGIGNRKIVIVFFYNNYYYNYCNSE